MPALRYSALTHDEVGLLLAPGAEDAERAWDRLTGGLHTLLHLLTLTYPRPLVPEEDARRDIPEAVAALRNTPFHQKALGNARVVHHI
ncbi:MAG TPA: hypothetical protein VK358_12860, partial [Longimicrobium sp.]|nr:hypothetical protein [Longimicrobium sp.]